MIVGIRNRRHSNDIDFRAELRESALELFAQRGFDAVCFGDIAFAAGISERLLRLYFQEKEDLLLGGFCESAPAFRQSLMGMPRTMAPVDAFHLAMLNQSGAPISLERVFAISIHSKHSSKLRRMADELRQRWQDAMSEAIAAWFGNGAEVRFRSAYWAPAIYNAIMASLAAQAGQAGLNAASHNQGKIIEMAFEDLRLQTMAGSPARH